MSRLPLYHHRTPWFASRGLNVEAALSDNGNCYRSSAWPYACGDLGIKHRRIMSFQPRTNGKIKRIHRMMRDGWACSNHCDSEIARRSALPAWLHFYNQHRQRSATSRAPAITRVNNLPGHHI